MRKEKLTDVEAVKRAEEEYGHLLKPGFGCAIIRFTGTETKYQSQFQNRGLCYE